LGQLATPSLAEYVLGFLNGTAWTMLYETSRTERQHVVAFLGHLRRLMMDEPSRDAVVTGNDEGASTRKRGVARIQCETDCGWRHGTPAICDARVCA
jgi:hypothetical protein